MDEGKKSDERGRKESSTSGEEPDNKGGTVDDEEGTDPTDINGRGKEVEEKPFRNPENGKCHDREKCEDKENKKDDIEKEAISEAEKDNDGKGTKQKIKERKEDEAEMSVYKDETGECKDKSVKEGKEEVFKDGTGNEKGREVLQVADDKAHETEVQEVIDKGKVGLKMFPMAFLPSKEGNIQLETADHTVTRNNQDPVTYKEEAGIEVKMVSGNTMQSNNQATSSKDIIINEQGKKTNEIPKTVECPTEASLDKSQKEYATDKSMRTDSGDSDKEKKKQDLEISENMNKEVEEGMLTEVNKVKPCKEHDVTKKEREMKDGRTVTIFNNAVHGMADVELNASVTLVNNEVCHTLQKEAKNREDLSFIDVDEGPKGMIKATQEEKSKDEAGEMSSSKETMKHLVLTETATDKQELWKTHEKEETEANSKANEELNIKDFNDTEKGKREEYENREQQKEPNDDERVLDLDYKSSFMVKVIPESSAQKSVEKDMEHSQEKQTCTSQETTVKLNEKHIAKNNKILASEMILPPKKSYESDQSRGILDMSVTDKPICTVFQGTVTRDAKCEESIQRSDVTHSSQNQENNKVKVGNSFSTEAAISDQLKQLECKFQQSIQEKPAPLKPQPLRQQTQQKEQKQQTQLQEKTQKQQQEQNQMKQKQQKEEKMPAQQNEQQQKQQKTQNRHKKEEKEQAEQKQVRQTQQPVKQKIEKTQKHEEKKCTQQNQQQSVIGEQVKIHEQKLVEHKKQKQPQTNEKSQQKQQEQMIKKQFKQEIKNETEEQQWQPEQKCKQQHIQSHKQEKERDSKTQPKQENQQQQQFQLVKQPQQETTQKNQSKWPQQEQKPKEQGHKQPKQQVPKQITHEQEEEKQKQQSRPDKGHHQQEQQPTQQSEEGEDDSVPGCGGTQGRSCPIYFGVKSYLHHFYDSAPVKDSQLYEDYIEEDDFEYTVDPVKHRGCRKCCHGFWFRAGLWGGINLILLFRLQL
ncbi:golgin subfamily A member 6-like protein 22 isoform X2 [Cryptotermes secundus]|nr:golgin subfamily A member 6-like protein 22 isoform X2 [Cryptotermes secundus]